MKKHAWLILCLIALVAGFALAATNLVTAGPIEQQRIQATQAARVAVFPDASSFEEMTIDGDTGLDSVYTAKSDTETLGYVLQITVAGYGGPIEIIMGVDTQGVITGLTVGGSKFAETAGLGTQVKEPAFTDQFVGLSEMPTLNGNVDTISGATISSSAVINGIIRCYQEWEALTGASVPSANAVPLYEDGVFIGEADGFIGPVRVSVTVKNDQITEIKVLSQTDSDAIFAMAREAIIPAVIQQNGTEGIDAVTGATYSSLGLLGAIENALCATCALRADESAPTEYTDGVFAGEAQGFSGKILLTVTVENGAITSVKVLEQNDTDAIFAMARYGVLPEVVLQNGTAGVDTVTGATYSSQGLLDAVDNALSGGVLYTDTESDAAETVADGVYIGKAQGFMSEIKVSVTVQNGVISTIKVLSQGDTSTIFARAQEGILPAVIEANGTDGVDTVSGATYSSQGLLDAIAEALCGECNETADAVTAADYSDGVFVGEAQGYMGLIKVAVTVIDGSITAVRIVSQSDTDTIFYSAKDGIVPAVLEANGTVGVDTVTGATYSSQGILDAINNALQTPLPKTYHYLDGVYEGQGQGYDGAVKVSVTIENSAVVSVEILETGDNATMFAMVADAIIPGVIASNTASGVDAVADATYSSRGLLDAIADALSKASAE